MCFKTALIILFLCMFLHACNAAQSSAPTTSVSHKKLHPHKIEKKLLKFNNLLSPNGRVTFRDGMPSRSAEDLCKKNEAIKGPMPGSSEDCKSSLRKALQHVTKSKGSRWPHLNVKEMDLHSTSFTEEDLSETDYQPPHRKSPIHNK